MMIARKRRWIRGLEVNGLASGAWMRKRPRTALERLRRAQRRAYRWGLVRRFFGLALTVVGLVTIFGGMLNDTLGWKWSLAVVLLGYILLIWGLSKSFRGDKYED